ncbi:styrene monooxygenase subunit StyA [Pseudonocardia abyssalis]|uniref:Monooxygenase n=1 Tax=Pseudonocardia abyssalis TaxID=2792008 RepID=A0ABS6URD7_9PSEU|nr:styrene monooxygenase/indole monooxygenase family protein [Pseudonocardia abyssalis]MBW0113754.1 monooxygenase [Pseudonocardia abyssalis]MBW0134827.1 monooxygenase [Pseudonocardia abyssalis]
MTKRIGIIGAGTAGLQLGLYLRQHDIEATIFTDRTPEEYASSRLPNTVAHHAVTVKREKALGLDHWSTDDYGYFGHHYYLGGPEPLTFYGDYEAPSRGLDYRIYHPRLMEDFVNQGGKIEYRTLDDDDVPKLSAQFDLLVVCTGKGTFGRMFARDVAHSPHDKPQRALCVGVFKGISQLPTRAVVWSASPGAGEMIEIPFLTFGGMASALVFENHIGSDLEVLRHTRYDEDPKAFIKLTLDKLRTHYPMTAERVDESEFDLANGPLDILQGGVVPIVRETHVTLDDGTIALALGDVHATVDPVLGQGGNMASHAAWILGEEIAAQDVFDGRFVEVVDARRRDRVLAATRWTNFMLQMLDTLPPEFQAFIGALSQNRTLADEFTDNFNFPERQWDVFAHPERIGAWLSKDRTARELVAAG